jgi:hypothetical protein
MCTFRPKVLSDCSVEALMSLEQPVVWLKLGKPAQNHPDF